MSALGCTSRYSSLAQEKTGDFWVNERLFGSQICHTSEDIERADLVVLLGANPWMAHGVPNARKDLRALAADPGRHLIVIDPVASESVAHADLHLQLVPGTDAYLLAAILALLDRRGALDRDFLAERTVGWEAVRERLSRVPIDDWIAHAGVARGDVDKAVALIEGARAMSVRAELGIQQGRYSTLNSYLEKLLFLLTGHFGRPGTNNLHAWLQPLWRASKGERSPVTGMEEIAGVYPPNRFPAEVLSDSPERIRGAIVDGSNPANSAADTLAMEKAFAALDLLVVVDVALSETAALADYVLPAASQFEKWAYTLFSFAFPTNVFQLREPLFEPRPGTMTEPEIYTTLARAMGLLPDEATLAELRAAAGQDRAAFGRRFAALLEEQPQYAPLAAMILYRTLGATLANGAAAAAGLWPACHRLAGEHPDAVRRALGEEIEDAALGEALFDRLLESRSGAPFAIHDYDAVWRLVRHDDGKVHVEIPRLLDWLEALDPKSERADPRFPFILMAGQRRSYNANQILRSPAWRKSDTDGALRIHPGDLAEIGALDGEWVSVETRTARITVRAEADERLRRGLVAMPHGYGMAIDDIEGVRVTNGPRVNLLTASEDCDPIAATPYHKAVAAAVERATNEEVDRSEADAERVRAVIAAAGGG
jgi:anaerobic selenocysteine-containing dehydrogenase